MVFKTLFVCLSTCLLLIASSGDDDRLQQVIDATDNVTIKKKLTEFRKNGIERPVDTSHYDKEKLIELSKTYLGSPHKMGGLSKKGIDCSGFMMVIHNEFGVKLPHSAHEQARYGTIIPSIDSLQKGDMVFFYASYASSNFITHSGVYIGEGEFIHTSNSCGVIVSKMEDKYWGPLYLFATRFSNQVVQ